MEKFPPALAKDPKPLVFVIGNVDSDASFKENLVSLMMSYLQENDQKDLPAIEFRLIKSQQYFPEKKPPKEIISTDGVLKLNWITKYNDILPSVVMLTFSFSAEWPITEWVRRESTVLEYVTKIKNSLYSREIKLMLVPYRTGAGQHDVYEDRVNSMKKRFQLDGRHITILSATDLIGPGTTAIKRLSKSIREMSMSFYVSQAKRIRNTEKGLKATEPMLIARYNFKVSFLSEFQGQSARALRHYRTTYSALTSMYEDAAIQTTPDGNTGNSIYEQTKAVAEWVNYKICLLHLKVGSLKEASQQLRLHMISFSKPVAGSPPWSHYAWMSDQYVIFAQILDRCSVNPALIDADRSYYYQNAAAYSTKRHASFYGIKKTNDEAAEAEHSLQHRYKGMVVASPRFVGGPPMLHDPVLDIASNSNETEMKQIIDYLQRAAEKRVDHKSLIIDLLKKSLDALGPLQKRRRAMIRYLMAKQFMIIGKYELASMNLNPGIEILSKDNWSKLLVAMLRKKMACALYLGRSKEYVIAALKLVAVAASDNTGVIFGRHEREELHRDILSVIFSQGPPTPEYLASLLSDTSNAGVGYVGVTWRPQFGIAATEGHPAEFILSNQQYIEFSDAGIDLFKVKTNFTPATVAIGQCLRVTVTITSNFQGCMSFEDMTLHFTDDVLIQKLTHDGSSAGDGNGGAILPKGSGTADTTGEDGIPFKASLVFPPGTPIHFSMDIFVPESSIGGYIDAYACLEKIRLTMRIPKFVDSSSPGKDSVASPTVAETVDSIISDSTKSFGPATRQPSHAIGIAVVSPGNEEIREMLDGDDNDMFVSASNYPLEEADAQFIPDEDEGEKVEYLTTSAVAGSELVDNSSTSQGGSLPRRRSDSAGSSIVAMVPENLADEGLGDTIDSGDSVAIVTTRERMSSLSQMDLKYVMDSIDITPLMPPTPPSAIAEDGEETMYGSESKAEETGESFDNDTAAGEDKKDDGTDTESEIGREREIADEAEAGAEEKSAEEDQKINAAECEVTDSPFKSSFSGLQREGAGEDNTSDSVQNLAVDVFATPGEELNIASGGTPMFIDDKLNRFSSERGTPNPLVSAPSAEFEPDVIGRTSSSAQAELETGPASIEDQSALAVVEEDNGGDAVEVSAITSLPESKENIENKESPPVEAEKPISISAASDPEDSPYRYLSFDVITVSRMFREARSTATNMVLKDIADFVGPQAPRILHITRPVSNLKLLSDCTTSITALQGMIHRVNLVFSSETDEILNGKVFLSSDQSPQTATASLFWYPDINSVSKNISVMAGESSAPIDRSVLSSSRFLEGVTFRPFSLNGGFQPSDPLSLPKCGRRTIFSVPLFLKSDTQGSFTVKLKFEYVPLSVLTTPVSKEFEIKLTVFRPFALNFGFTSSIEAPCGAVLNPSANSQNQTQWRSVLRGDFINLSASLNCLNSLKQSIEVLALGVVVPSAAKQLAVDPKKTPVEAVFQLVDSTVGLSQKEPIVTNSNRYANLLGRHAAYSTDAPLVMDAGEKFVGSVEVKCLDVVDQSICADALFRNPALLLPPDVVSSSGAADGSAVRDSAPLPPISIGNISIKWRTSERTQLCPVDLSSYLELIPETIRADYCIGSSWENSADPSKFDWLLPVSRGDKNPDNDSVTATRGLVTDISRTLVCSMTFMVPAIQVIDAPFRVDVDSVAVAELGQPMTLTITVSNKLWSIERLCVSAALCNRFLITGCTLRTLEVAPKGSIAIRYVLVPLLVGHCPMPTIRVTWEKMKTTIVEVGSTENPRHVFVMPGPKQLAL